MFTGTWNICQLIFSSFICLVEVWRWHISHLWQSCMMSVVSCFVFIDVLWEICWRPVYCHCVIPFTKEYKEVFVCIAIRALQSQGCIHLTVATRWTVTLTLAHFQRYIHVVPKLTACRAGTLLNLLGLCHKLSQHENTLHIACPVRFLLVINFCILVYFDFIMRYATMWRPFDVDSSNLLQCVNSTQVCGWL